MASNGIANGHQTGSDKSPSPVPITFPRSQHELNVLLNKYHQLLHEDTLEEREIIEAVLEKVSAQQHNFVKEQQEFEQELFTEASDSINTDLFSKQVAALQLLAADYGLSEPLVDELNDDNHEEKQSDDDLPDVDSVFSTLSAPEPNGFEERVEYYGTPIQPSIHTAPPTKAPLGNFYTEKAVSSRVASHLRTLESLPANLGTMKRGGEQNDDLKLTALVELKGLRLLSKQKQLKHNILLHHASQSKFSADNLSEHPLILQEKRSFNKKPKQKIEDAKLLAQEFQNIKKLREKSLRFSKHIEKVEKIVSFSEQEQEERAVHDNFRLGTLFRQINNYHTYIEKEESRKTEKTAKQRLQALKANDEEAYIKLLDETKDHRITHLLRQTNQFLDTLAQQVVAHQQEGGAPPIVDEHLRDEVREKIDYYQVAHRIKEEIKEQPTILVGGKLKEYQIKGLQWMVSLYNNKLNGILADEMGLGKTIQSISLITYLIEKKHEEKFLVIVPLSTITNWTLEFEKWAPAVKVIVYKGSPGHRRALQYDIKMGNFQVMLTTFEYVIKERLLLSKFNYSHMIIDEGHRMKNANSKLSVTLRTYYKTKNRLILTGTPLQNNLPELWALLNFVLPRIFNSVKSFDEWFNTPFANTGSQEKIELTEEESLLVIRRLHKVLRPFLLRRLKKDVEKDLPNKVEKVLKCNLSGLQYILYQQMLKHNALFVGDEIKGIKLGIKGLNNKIMQLRKICNHPFVFEEVETILQTSKITNDLIWRTSGKFELLDRILPKFRATGHRVLMFFQMTQVMDIMEDYLRWKDMMYMRLDGATKADDRQDMLKAFNADDSEYFCFLLSTRAGGLGLNLQTADTVIIFDTDWNPHQDLQAQDRAHRIGQKNEVKILRLITNDSVEEVILERAHQKLDIDGKVIQAGKFDNKSTAEEQEEFLKRLLENDLRNNDEENDLLDDDELNEVCARSDDELRIFAEIDRQRKQQDTEADYLSRLIEKEELPSVFTEDISHHFVKDVKELTKMREKKRVRYDDGLTEEQWLMAMDDDNDTVEDAIRRKEERMARRRGRDEDDDEDDDEIIEDDEEEEEFEPRKRQRRSRTPTATPTATPTPAVKVDPEFKAQCFGVIDEITKLEDPEDGHNLSEIFLKLPLKKLYPDYYQVIHNPVALQPLKKSVNQGAIATFDEFLDQLLLMCSNAKTYNQEGSFVYTDAEKIEELVQGYKEKIE